MLTECISTYADCMKIVGKRQSKKLAPNTYLKIDDNNEYYILFHKTRIATYHRYDGLITLNTDGWQTVTTKNRLNRFTPVRVYSELGIWYIYYLDKKYVWKDNITIDYHGRPFGLEEANTDIVEEKKKLDSRVNRYVKKYVNHYLQLKQEPMWHLGDCLYCSKNIPDYSHLVMHIEEKYYVGSLYQNALVDTQHNNAADILRYHFTNGEIHWLMERVLSGYFRKRKHGMLKYIMNQRNISASGVNDR